MSTSEWSEVSSKKPVKAKQVLSNEVSEGNPSRQLSDEVHSNEQYTSQHHSQREQQRHHQQRQHPIQQRENHSEFHQSNPRGERQSQHHSRDFSHQGGYQGRHHYQNGQNTQQSSNAHGFQTSHHGMQNFKHQGRGNFHHGSQHHHQGERHFQNYGMNGYQRGGHHTGSRRNDFGSRYRTSHPKHNYEEMPTTVPDSVQLQTPFSFWVQATNVDYDEYDSSLHELCSFSTIPEFWHYYQYLLKPSQIHQYWMEKNEKLQPQVIQCFRQGIKPAWEDENNKQGGKWFIRVKHEYTDRLWEELLLAFIGEQLSVDLHDQGEHTESDINEVCGIVLDIRDHDLISVWHRSSNDFTVRETLRERIKKALHLPAGTYLEYKPHKTVGASRSSGEYHKLTNRRNYFSNKKNYAQQIKKNKEEHEVKDEVKDENE